MRSQKSAAAAALGAFLIAAPPALAQLGKIGERDYVRYCALCHGLEGTGLGPLADAMKTAAANLPPSVFARVLKMANSFVDRAR